MSIKVMKTPSKYIQGKDALKEFKEHTEFLGESFFVITGKTGEKITRNILEHCFEDSRKSLVFEIYDGLCSIGEIDRIRNHVQNTGSDVIVGIGGGSTIDLAKAVAYYEKLPIVVVPTIASTDAPCSALSVIYSDDGKLNNYLYYPANPNVVIVDTQIISNAPARFFVAGMGDALSTYIEAKACMKSELANKKITNAGFALARTCFELLLLDGYKAKLTVEKKCVTQAVENIVEANIYLSGVGFENTGLAVAHLFYNCITSLEECRKFMHGEIVAFGSIVQLVFENSNLEDIKQVTDFCVKVGLPTTLKEIGIEDTEYAHTRLRQAINTALEQGRATRNAFADVDPVEFYNAVILADNINRTEN